MADDLDKQVSKGVQEHYPWFTLPIPEAEELKAFTDNVTAFMDRGLEVSAAQIREKFGLNRRPVPMYRPS